MAVLTSTVIAVAAVATTAYSMYQGNQARKDAKFEQYQARKEQDKINSEQRAVNASQQAAERRKQIREERIRRARIIQSSNNMGVGQSSGVMGGLSGLATQLGSNMGTNLGLAAAGERVSQFSQNSAQFQANAQAALGEAQKWDQAGQLSGSIFSAAGGFGALKKAGTWAGKQFAPTQTTISNEYF